MYNSPAYPLKLNSTVAKPPPLRRWWLVNLRSLPYLVIVPVLLSMGYFLDIAQGHAWGKVFSLEAILNLLEFLWIPGLAINLVYAANLIIERTAFSFWQQMTLRVIFCLLGALIATGVMEIIYAYHGITDDDYIAMGNVKLSPTMTNFVTNGLLAVAISLPVFFSQERKKRLERSLEMKKIELQKLERLNAVSRLEMLQSKLNPHFLYNSLNMLAGLVYSHPKKAEQVILGLSDIFRYSLQKDDRKIVSLEEELEIVKTYLNIEMLRFEGMLEYHIDVDGSLMNWRVPRFLLQPLVENAIKHGTSAVASGKIRIVIRQNEKEELDIRIEDNGKAFPENVELGFGMGSTIEKLSLLLPENHEFGWANEPVKSVHILLKGEAHEPA